MYIALIVPDHENFIFHMKKNNTLDVQCLVSRAPAGICNNSSLGFLMYVHLILLIVMRFIQVARRMVSPCRCSGAQRERRTLETPRRHGGPPQPTGACAEGRRPPVVRSYGRRSRSSHVERAIDWKSMH